MTDFTKIVQSYSEHGLSCLPTKPDKSPASPANWKLGFKIDAFNDCHGIGIICGAKSGNLEVFDFDNHAGDATINLAKYLGIPEIKEIYEKHKFPIEKTLSGGYHILIRCEHVEGNRKLASKLLNGKPDCFIETRGEGGYFCADPTPGYAVVRNEILNVPILSKIERAVLFDNAISMNEYFPSLKTEFEQTDRPGDLYNASSGAIIDMKSSLQGLGWQEVGGHTWRRPGKKEGISATLGKVAPNVFYVFTANAYPFEPNKAYTPFQVLGLVKYNGDFKEAAKSIAPEREQRQVIPGKMQLFEIEKILLGALIDTRKHIEKPPTILSIKEQTGTQFQYNRVLTLGNFSCIIGKAKSKKTFFISLITAALLSNDGKGKFIGELPANKNEILYFDTEQGEYDSYNVIR
ncbi:MAG TPA: bifunctional DNA primase/polymerase, partial [Prolixibacteraceae bacterium]